MSNEYKRLNDELDSADLESVLPGFDREASWKELQPRLKKTNNKTYVWRYAAALIAIMIIGALVKMQMNKQLSDEQVATTAPAVTPKANDTGIAPAPQKVETPIVLHVTAKTRKATAPKVKQAHDLIKPAPQPQHVEEQIAVAQQETKQQETTETTEQPVVNAKPIVKRPKAIHLLDIDNENRQAVIQNRKELQGGLPQRIVNLIPGRQYSNTDDDRKPASLFKVN